MNMKKSILWIIGLLLVTSFSIVSCDETDGAVDPYFKWEERNKLYIDSIAKVAKANLGNEVGQWKMIHTYKFNPPINELTQDVNDYVYCRVLAKGDGAMKPLFTDEVSAHYRGKLIPLYDGTEVVFDQSYQGNLNPEVAVPVSFAVNELIEGWTTVLMQMVEGDRWEIHIPYGLGYGIYGQSDIPGYSALVFDMQLVDISTNR